MSCIVNGCLSRRESGKVLFKFPDQQKKRDLHSTWIEKLSLPSSLSYRYQLVCEDHFDQSCFEGNLMDRLLGLSRKPRRLKPGAVPTRAFFSKSDENGEHLPIRQTETHGTKRMAGRPVFAEINENVTPTKKRKQAVKVTDRSDSAETMPVMVNVGTQTLDTFTAQTSRADHSYFRVPPSPHLDTTFQPPLDTAFIGSPQQQNSSVTLVSTQPSTPEKPGSDDLQPDSSDHKSSSPPSSPDKPDSDESYVPSDHSSSSNQSSSSDQSSDSEHTLTIDPKAIVFESCLKSLFGRVICTECGDLVSADDSTLFYQGTALKVKFTCMKGQQTSWESQPMIDRRPAGNVMVATAIDLSGETSTRISHFADILSLKFLGPTQFYSIQQHLTIPAIDRYYHMQRDVGLEQLRGHQLVLGGDGRCDSPGFSAKYCTYTFMDTATGVIPDFNVVQVSETSSSTKMELLGFQRSISNIEAEDLSVGVVVTDRHVQIRKSMNTEHTDKKHQFDVWHLSKSVKKKIAAIKPTKVQTQIKPWIPSICNHLWWCSSQANGDPDKLEELWRSLLHHICNRHTFPGKMVTKCGHAPLSPDDARKKKWLQEDSPAYHALERVLIDKLLIKDIRQLDLFCHTGSLETYHSMMLKYCLKRQEFDYPSMVARTQLAVIDNNVNIGRPHKTTANGEPVYTTRCPKTTGRWTARKVYEKKNYSFKRDILEFSIDTKEDARTTTSHQVKALTLPANISRKPAPCKDELISGHRSRFH